MLIMRGSLICFVFFAVITLGAPNLLRDGDFEYHKYPSSNWNCNGGCRMTPMASGKIGGHQSVKFSGRSKVWEGPRQQVPLVRNTRYHFVFYVKQLNNRPGKVFQQFKVSGQFDINGAKTIYPDFAVDENVHVGRGWVKLEGYIKMPDVSFTEARVLVSGPEPSIDYLVDSGSITLLPEDTNWKSEADKRIDQLRKNNIHFRIHVPSNTNPQDFTVEVKLNKHAFPFGSMIKTDHVMESKNSHYRQLYYSMFNWATLANYYWKWSKGPYNHPDYSKDSQALNILRQHGIPVRGHNIFWGTDTNKYMPDEVMKLSADDLKKAVNERIRYIVSKTKGHVDHWDVSNEMLHNHYFEEKTGDPYYSHHMYSYLHQLDPNVKLFLNDYSVIANGQYASAYVSQAKEYKNAKVGLYGLGVQCHFYEYEKPDATLIKNRLDQLSATGYPLWATELDVVVADENTRAVWYDITLRVLFSHPSIEGIIFWDFFGPEHWRGPNAGLVSDRNYRVNAAGKHYLDLIYKEWSTHSNQNLGSGKSFSVRGFHGDYEVIVKYKGTAVKDQKFTLGKSDQNVDVTVTDINARPHIVSTPNPIVNHGDNHNHVIIHTGEYSIGTDKSDDSSFTCTTAWSGYSALGDDKFTDVSCPKGYVMTGCTSESKSPSDKKDGESIETDHGVVCRAWNGFQSTSPVQSSARCCKRTGLLCNYFRSHSSPDTLNVRVETKCPKRTYATGCSAHNYMHDMAGTYPTPTSCIAQNHMNVKGVEPFAICCNAPDLHCVVKKSRPTGLSLGSQVKLRCDVGYHMTGCHGFSEDGGLSSTYVYKDECVTINGAQKSPDMLGVTAYATCCK